TTSTETEVPIRTTTPKGILRARIPATGSVMLRKLQRVTNKVTSENNNKVKTGKYDRQCATHIDESSFHIM
ncbi:MAG: hypothetical protein P8105_13530, partial [Dehalococcoidia bacterium]